MSCEADPKETNSLGDKNSYMIGIANTDLVLSNLYDSIRFMTACSTRPSYEMLICAEYEAKVEAYKVE